MNEFDEVIKRMCNISEIRIVSGKVEGAISFRIRNREFFILSGKRFDTNKEIRKLKEELTYTEGFLAAVVKKLSNENFIANAPTKVIDLERKKEADARVKIALIKENLILFDKK